MAYVQATLIADVGQRVVAEFRLHLNRHVQSLSQSIRDTT